MLGDEHLPLIPPDPAPPGPQVTVRGDVFLGAAAAVDIGAGIRRVGQRGMHRMICRFHPHDVRGRRCRTGGGLQRPLQFLLPQPQPGRADRPARGEPGEHRGDHPGDGLVRVQQDLALVLAPDQPDRQAAPQFPAFGLVAYPAVQPGPQHVELCLSGSRGALLRPGPLRTVRAACHRTRLKQAPKARGQAEVRSRCWPRRRADVGSGCAGAQRVARSSFPVRLG